MLLPHFEGDVFTHLKIKLSTSLLRRLTQPLSQALHRH